MSLRKASRGASRFLASLPAILHYRGHDYSCAAHNLSRTGVLLIGEVPPSEGQVEITIRSPAGDLELRTPGCVQRIQAGADSMENQIGIEFREMPQGQRSTLESLISRVVEGVIPAALESLSEDSTDPEIREALTKVPLPHRVALAGRAMPREREILLQDPSPQVLEALARNPNLLQHEARSLLRLHTLLPTTLEVLAQSRWGADEEMKILIASHTRASFALAERLVASLSPEGVRKVLQRPGLNAGLRTKIVQKLPRRAR
jgi:hypothetical protein